MKAQRIVPPATAFSLSRSKQKRPRKHDNKHLKWIRTLPCIVTGIRTAIHAAHIRYADPRYGKRETGAAEKPDDRWVVPLHWVLHQEQHETNERAWWRKTGIDPAPIALALYNATGDDDVAEVILQRARKRWVR